MKNTNHKYKVDLYRGNKFVAHLHGFHHQESAVAYAHSVWHMQRDKPENKGFSWHVNEIIFDGEGEPSFHVTIAILNATAR